MPKSIPIPEDFAVGSTVTFLAGPTKVERTGTVKAHSGQFVVVDVNGKERKTRPGSIRA